MINVFFSNITGNGLLNCFNSLGQTVKLFALKELRTA